MKESRARDSRDVPMWLTGLAIFVIAAVVIFASPGDGSRTIALHDTGPVLSATTGFWNSGLSAFP
jgi:hypothetical protein